jgi:hypothetical protein
MTVAFESRHTRDNCFAIGEWADSTVGPAIFIDFLQDPADCKIARQAVDGSPGKSKSGHAGLS